jgi:hypothetical protein
MARTRSTQIHLECVNSPEQYRTRLAGETWINESAIRMFLAGLIGERKAREQMDGGEPWSNSRRADFYALFDLLSPQAQESIARCFTSFGGSVPARPEEGRVGW